MLPFIKALWEPKAIHRLDMAMGTVVTQLVYGKGAREAVEATAKELRRLEKLLSFHDPDSDINKINASAGLKPTSVHPDVISVLNTALRVSELSMGAFDVTVGPLVRLWDFRSPHPTLPDMGDIKAGLALVDYTSIDITAEPPMVSVSNPGQSIDLGGVAKGYVTDRMAQTLGAHGVRSACLNLGGNVLVIGVKPDGKLWEVGLQHPAGEQGKYFAVVRAADKSIVTSGVYERYFEFAGERYHHIIDPRTGWPAESGVISTTIVGESSALADAVATTVLVMGLAHGIELVRRLGLEAVVVTTDSRIYVTDGLTDSIHFVPGLNPSLI